MRHLVTIKSDMLKPGHILGDIVEKVWVDDFIDEDNNAIIPVERHDIIGYPFDKVTPDMIKEIKSKGISQVKVYKN